jgi:hypothetical protein
MYPAAGRRGAAEIPRRLSLVAHKEGIESAGRNVVFEPEYDSPLEYLSPPYRRFAIDTLMRREAVVAGVQQIVEPRKFWRLGFLSDHHEFQGEVTTTASRSAELSITAIHSCR